MALGDNSFVYNFEIVHDGKVIGAVTAKGRELNVWIFGGARTAYRLADIASVALIHAEGANLARGGSGAVVGALVAGPLGAVAGAALGRLLRECHFTLVLNNGRSFLCKGLVKIYEDFEAHRAIVALPVPSAAKIDTIAASSAPAHPAVAPMSTADAKPTAITVPVRTAQPMGVLVVQASRATKP